MTVEPAALQKSLSKLSLSTSTAPTVTHRKPPSGRKEPLIDSWDEDSLSSDNDDALQDAKNADAPRASGHNNDSGAATGTSSGIGTPLHLLRSHDPPNPPPPTPISPTTRVASPSAFSSPRGSMGVFGRSVSGNSAGTSTSDSAQSHNAPEKEAWGPYGGLDGNSSSYGGTTFSASPGTKEMSDAKRPEKTDAVAKRLIAGALGVRAPKRTDEQKAYERANMEKEARRREKEKEDIKRGDEERERARAAVWDD